MEWFESVNRYNINFVTNLEAEEFISTFQNFIKTSVQGRVRRTGSILMNKYEVSLEKRTWQRFRICGNYVVRGGGGGNQMKLIGFSSGTNLVGILER